MNIIKILIIICIISGSFISRAQIVDCPININYAQSVTYTSGLNQQGIGRVFDYKQTKEWKNYKTLRAIGWSALGVGVPVTFLGGVLSAFQSSISGSGSLGIPVIVAGGVMTLSSIPLLTCAYYYRRKAIKLKVSMSSVESGFTSYTSVNYSPALSFAVSF